MKSYFKKISFLLLSITLLLGACRVEESLIITSPEATFKLEQPGVSSVFLNFNLPNNPAFTVVWKDEVTNSNTYEIQMAFEDTFATPVVIGSSNNKSFTISVEDLNTAINDAGITDFKDVAIYIRIKGGDKHTNYVLFLVTTYPMNPPVITSIADGDNFVLTLANNDLTAVTVEWEDPVLDSGLGVDVVYTLEAGTVGTSFATPIEIANLTNLNSVDVTNSQLNTAAITSGIAVDTSGDLDIRVKAVITDLNTGATLERISEKVTINVTTYLTVLDLSTTWGVVGSGAPNGWGGPDAPFYQTDVAGVLVAYVTLTDGQIKFRENNDWANNYGDNGADGTLESGGANIDVTAGSYKITFDLNNLTYTIESFSIGIVGGAYNNWGATPDFALEYDPYSDVFRGIVTLIDGEMKFRMNNDWGTNWGDNGNDGTLELNGANIVVTAGIYIATVDMNNLTYTLEPIDYVWGLVGGAYNNWGATPDAQFKRDWSKPFETIWILENVTLIDGEFKFRANNDWGTNYGDNGNDGTLELNGANISTTAGTYTFTLDFTDSANPTYTKN